MIAIRLVSNFSRVILVLFAMKGRLYRRFADSLRYTLPCLAEGKMKKQELVFEFYYGGLKSRRRGSIRC
jgi:hypothetical protein